MAMAAVVRRRDGCGGGAQGACGEGDVMDAGVGRRALAEKGTMLMSKGFYGDALVVYDKCLSIQLQVC
jgi:hypothetical protein